MAARNKLTRAHFYNAERKQWMHALARSDADELVELLHCLKPSPRYDLVGYSRSMPVSAPVKPGYRKAGRLSRTMTHCEVRLASGITGRAALPGNNRHHAKMAALFDALLQDVNHHDELMVSVNSSINLAGA